jgi:hypothetical protein
MKKNLIQEAARFSTSLENGVYSIMIRFYKKISELFKQLGFSKEKTILEKTFVDFRPKMEKKLFSIVLLSFDSQKIKIQYFNGKSIDLREIYLNAIKLWVEEKVAKLITSISESTKIIIKSIVKSGISSGKSNSQISKEISDNIDQFSKVRSRRIARTETHSATEFGSYSAAKESGLDLVKIWGATNDERTRNHHSEADGQIREISENFTVGDGKLLFPGDPKGDAKNIINCRCTCLYVPRGVKI